MKKTLLILALATLLIPEMSAIRARKEYALYTQPDGSSFKVKITGDEWSRRITTSDGAAIIRDASGFWCYALADSQGRKYSSATRIGTAVSEEILTRSRAAASAVPGNRHVLRREELRRALRSASPSRAEATSVSTEIRVLVILAQTPDLKFSVGRQQFIDLASKKGYDFNGATGCIEEYFEDQLDGKYHISIDVSDIVTLRNNMAYYGANNSDDEDSRPAELVAEACRLAHDSSSNPVNFAEYDSDSDGYVDNVFVMVAGGDEADGAGDDHIWSHSWALSAARINLKLDGKTIDSYAISTELADLSGSLSYHGTFTGIGTFCHEFSHLLGLSDLYDTDYEKSGGTSNGMFLYTALMDNGNINNGSNTPPNYNAVDLDQLGLGVCEQASGGLWTLHPISKEKRYLRINTDNDDEYFLVECRDNSGWDAYIKGNGLAIYHIDKSTRSAGYSDSYRKTLTAHDRWYFYNEVNCRPDHQCAEFVPANTKATTPSQAFFPYSSKDSFGPTSNPAMKWWSGAAPDVAISDITRNSDGSVSFVISKSQSGLEATVFQDAAILHWEGPASSYTVRLNGETVVEGLKPYSAEAFACVLGGLSPNTEYVANIESGDEKGSISFKTKAHYSSGHPFIYLIGADRDSDGRFRSGAAIALRVYNAPYALSVRWSLNGKPISVSSDGYYYIKEEGTLKAEVSYEDGSKDIIVKEIKLL